MSKVFLLVSIFAIWKLITHEGQVTLGPGVMVNEAPLQINIIPNITHQVNGYSINEVAKFNIKAKVLAKERYYSSRESDVSPIDLALGWGNMSDERVLEQINISQSGRFYYWAVDSFPIPRAEIESQSANMHIIPANDIVRSVIKSIKKGDIIELSGSLVNVTANDGWLWKSSLTRNDTGAGACEVIWVNKLRVITPYIQYDTISNI